MDAPPMISARTVTLEIISKIFEANDIDADWNGPEEAPEGLTVQWETAICYVELSELGAADEDEWRYLVFTAPEPVKATADRQAILRFVRRINRKLRLIRASFDGGNVVFDYTAILTGGEMPSLWVVGCLALFDNAIRQAKEYFDPDKVLE